MHAITIDPDSGVVDQCCRPLNSATVFDELALCIKRDEHFLGKPPKYWQALLDEGESIVAHAQEITDEADPDEYEFWGVRFLEVT